MRGQLHISHISVSLYLRICNPISGSERAEFIHLFQLTIVWQQIIENIESHIVKTYWYFIDRRKKQVGRLIIIATPCAYMCIYVHICAYMCIYVFVFVIQVKYFQDFRPRVLEICKMLKRDGNGYMLEETKWHSSINLTRYFCRH